MLFIMLQNCDLWPFQANMNDINDIINDIGDSHYMSKADGTALLKMRKVVLNIMLVTIVYATHQVRSV